MSKQQGAIRGLGISTDGSTVSIQTGSCRNDADTGDIDLSAPVVVNPSTVGAGGIDSGSLQPSTAYAVWVIASSNAVAGLLSASFAASGVSFPGGFGAHRRVGTVLTDGAGNFRGFGQTGDDQQRVYRYNGSQSSRQILSGGTATAWTAVAAPSLVPPSRNVIRVVIHQSGGIVELRPAGSTDGAEITTSGDQWWEFTPGPVEAETLEFRNTGSGGSTDVAVTGFEERV